MKVRRGRRVAFLSLGLGLAVLTASGLAFRGRISEEYWLWRLKSGGPEEREDASRRLSARSSGPLKQRLLHIFRHAESWEVLEASKRTLDRMGPWYEP